MENGKERKMSKESKEIFTPEMQERVKEKIAEMYPKVEYRLAKMAGEQGENVIRAVKNALGIKSTVSFRDTEEKALFYSTLKTLSFNIMMRSCEMLKKADESMDYMATAHYMSATAYTIAWYLECARMTPEEFKIKMVDDPVTKAGREISEQYESENDG